MKISAVIPVINESSRLADAIQRAWDAGVDEVVVSDGGSTDGSIEIAESADCFIIHSPKGRGIQLNAGVQKATGDIFLFLHADTFLAKNACQQIRSLVETRSQIPQNAPSETVPWLFGGFRQSIDDIGAIFRLIEQGNALRVRWQGLVYGDQAMFVSRTLYQRVGGFPAEPLMEDYVLSRKLAKLEWPILLSGPLTIDVRRWKRSGPVRQTIRNWCIVFAFRMGVSPERLSKFYRRHDK